PVFESKPFGNVGMALQDVYYALSLLCSNPAIVNGVYWSESLNKVFVDNFDRDPSLIWQYFGSAKGFFRQYPGIKWEPDENGVIAFDCRNRKYIQAATSPKDVVILVDVSGSMKGLRLTIAKQTVSSILDTLGDDDFFNIIAYNEELHYVEPCLNGTLVQADRANKEKLNNQKTDSAKKLSEIANKRLLRVNVDVNEHTTASAVILLLHVDRGRLSAEAQLEALMDDMLSMSPELVQYKQQNETDMPSSSIINYRDFNHMPQYCAYLSADYTILVLYVRIFTYLIGREAAFADNLKWMACANKGFFTQISTLADVQENVMEYLHVLSRPKVIDQEHDVVWTEAYIDSTLADDQGLVLMTTVAMPVFSKQNETRSKGILLGVVGTDVPVKELLKTIPKYKLGIHGYAFAITNNGYILTHPELRPLYEEGKKRRKPNYSSVDLSEVEWEDRDDVLRNAMVNRKTGKFSMEVKKTVDKGKRVLVMTNDYYYTDIKGTPFSLGVALSRGHGKYFFRGNVTVEEGLHDLEHPDVSLADEWSYCNTDLHPEHRQMTQLEAIKRYLTGKEPLLQCKNSDKGVEVAFLGTRTGLSRINLFVGPEQLTNQDFLTAEDKENIFNADHFPLWYRRAAEQIPGSFVYSIPFSTETANKSNVVTASTAIQLLDDRKSPVVAAVGIQMKLEFFQRKFWTASRQCASLDGRCAISCDDETINCYLIDNNGFILVSEDYQQTGYFFGEVEGAVMNKLLTMGSFKRITLYDYQAMCRTNKESSDSAHSLLDPYNAFFAAVKFLVEFNLCSWWHSDLTAKAQRLKQTLEPCDTEYPAFVSERTIKETTGNIACDDCFKSFVIQQIPSSNLFMVVVDNECFSSLLNCLVHNESLKCERLKSQKIRRRPESCHGFHPENTHTVPRRADREQDVITVVCTAKFQVQRESRLVKPVRRDGHKPEGLRGVCVLQPVPSPEGMAAAGAAWAEHTNDGYVLISNICLRLINDLLPLLRNFPICLLKEFPWMILCGFHSMFCRNLCPAKSLIVSDVDQEPLPLPDKGQAFVAVARTFSQEREELISIPRCLVVGPNVAKPLTIATGRNGYLATLSPAADRGLEEEKGERPELATCILPRRNE
ncbi:Voltage-dependent calcium channel subunit alpha-2/delta-3, partial [Lamprotornis superbus]